MVLIGYSDRPVFSSIPHVSIFLSHGSLPLSSYCRVAEEEVCTVMWLRWYLVVFYYVYIYIYICRYVLSIVIVFSFSSNVSDIMD